MATGMYRVKDLNNEYVQTTNGYRTRTRYFSTKKSAEKYIATYGGTLVLPTNR